LALGLAVDEFADTVHVRGPFHAPQIALILWRENVVSVQARYKQYGEATPYRFRFCDSPSVPRIIGGIKGLEYQSCEADDYRESLGFFLLEAIKDLAIYEVAEGWTIEESDIRS
jgi:hypothetical protein